MNDILKNHILYIESVISELEKEQQTIDGKLSILFELRSHLNNQMKQKEGYYANT